jgi:hypothetical protein
MHEDHIVREITSPAVSTQRVVDAPNAHTESATRVPSQTVTRSPQAFRGPQYSSRGQQGVTRGSQVASRGAQVASRGPQVASRGSQVATRGPQVAAKGPQVAAKGQQSSLAAAAKAAKNGNTKQATTSSSQPKSGSPAAK